MRWIFLGTGCLSILLAGKAAMAKLLMLIGLPALAAPLLEDPAIRGVALYQAGDYRAADDAFRAAGRVATYNRGLSLAVTGDLPLALAYFDAVLFANPADSIARENRNVVNALVPPHLGEANAAGRIAARVIASPTGVPYDEIKRLGKPLDAGGRVADGTWLESIQDEPGEFLRLRLEAEHLRRISMGLTAPDGGDPW